MAELPRAGFWADRTVRAAAALLPDPASKRYEREFLSELFGLNRWQQTRYALNILTHTASLRTVIRQQATSPDLTMTDTPHKPLTCRLNIHHRWVTKSTSDGGRYDQCRRCGTDKTDADVGPPGNNIAAFGAGTAAIGG